MTAAFRASVLTIFPEIFPGPLGHSLTGKALEAGIWSLDATNLRDFATDRHRSVDDVPFGGGAGMVMRADVIDRAVESVHDQADARPLIYVSPKGARFDHAMAQSLAEGPGCVILCGRYEGVDERVLEKHRFIEVSLGDFVLTGGEIAAMALLDATVRLLPGVVGREEFAGRRELRHRAPGVSALHPTTDLARAHGARRSAVGSPRPHSRLATRGCRRHHPPPPSRSSGRSVARRRSRPQPSPLNSRSADRPAGVP